MTKTTTANPCKGCPHWQHMDGQKSPTMYCACIQETGLWVIEPERYKRRESR